MSFILDALKKSENERQRQIGPSFAEVRVRRRRSDKPWWAFAVAALLIINLGVLVIVLARSDDARPITAQPEPSSSTATAAPRGTQQDAVTPGVASPAVAQLPRQAHVQTGPQVRALANEVARSNSDLQPEWQNSDLAAAATVPEGPPLVRPIEAPEVSPSLYPGTLESRTAQAQGNAMLNEVLPTLSDVTASGTNLPEMHLDIHVHSGNPSERFVFVNMRKYTEGQLLKEGPAVERITADGVVLNHHGLRFLLPRQ